MIRTVSGRLASAGRVGLLPAAFNPPTLAHVALADEAQRRFALDQVVYVLPEAMPHKRIESPSASKRLDWLVAIAGERPDRAVSTCRRGLVIDIVLAFRAALPDACRLFVIAGNDAAERYATWDYGEGMPFAEQLRHYRLLVAPRIGSYKAPSEHAGQILQFEIDSRLRAASSSAVRDAVRLGRRWDHLVPEAIRDGVAEAYREAGS